MTAPEFTDLRRRLAINVRNERVRQGISQDRLAEISGLNQKTISRLESCIYATSVDTIERIAFALRIDADQLLRKAEAGPADP